MKLLNQHIPQPTLMALVFEFVASASSVYLAGFARLGTHWPTQGVVTPSLPNALLIGTLTVIALAAMGLYQAHYRRLSREAVVARVGAALGLAALAETTIFYVAPFLAHGRGLWGLSVLFSFILIVVG